jgi:hypothetical protein
MSRKLTVGKSRQTIPGSLAHACTCGRPRSQLSFLSSAPLPNTPITRSTRLDKMGRDLPPLGMATLPIGWAPVPMRIPSEDVMVSCTLSTPRHQALFLQTCTGFHPADAQPTAMLHPGQGAHLTTHVHHMQAPPLHHRLQDPVNQSISFNNTAWWNCLGAVCS